MSKLYPQVDPEGLLEYSVVFTDRALNHMSQTFQQVMRDISATLKQVYRAEAVAVIPGGGTYGMEAVARQLATGQTCLVLRNGWFSYRWSQIFAMGSIPSREIVLKARPASRSPHAAWAPAPVEEVVAAIERERPALVFAPHVETSSGVLLPDDYVRRVGAATRAADGLFVLDSIASGALWVDMRALDVDVLISAPQKGWSAPPSSALVMLGARAVERVAATRSTSFAADLAKWLQIMRTYEDGGHAYHATLPTDALAAFRDSMYATLDDGLELTRDRQWELGRRVRAMFAEHGFKSVAAHGFAAPGVAVYHTEDPELHNTRKFLAQGLQVAAGVPLMCDEPAEFKTFRIGLFGLDKLRDVDGTAARLEQALNQLA